MESKKRVLLIAGGGTLGTYTAKELLRLGHKVDVICLDDKISDNDNLRYFKMCASVEALEKHFLTERYDGIVNFLHYENAEAYAPYHKLLTENTEHLIFLSSYRVYADEQHPITEEAPMLIDVSNDSEFLENEKYAIAKAKCERFLHKSDCKKNWTVVRPVISFSALRFDLLMYSGDHVIRSAKENQPIYLPNAVKDIKAGLDWSGNSGKLIANLLFKPEAIGEAYTISSAPELTWGEVADIYHDVIGAEIVWVDEEKFLDECPRIRQYDKIRWAYLYDRCFDRSIDNSKVLAATGLKRSDFCSVRDGLMTELDIYYKRKESE